MKPSSTLRKTQTPDYYSTAAIVLAAVDLVVWVVVLAEFLALLR